MRLKARKFRIQVASRPEKIEDDKTQISNEKKKPRNPLDSEADGGGFNWKFNVKRCLKLSASQKLSPQCQRGGHLLAARSRLRIPPDSAWRMKEAKHWAHQEGSSGPRKCLRSPEVETLTIRTDVISAAFGLFVWTRIRLRGGGRVQHNTPRYGRGCRNKHSGV